MFLAKVVIFRRVNCNFAGAYFNSILFKMRKLLFFLVLGLLPQIMLAQGSWSHHLRVDAAAVGAVGDQLPFWLHSGREGRWDFAEQQQLLGAVGGGLQWTPGEHWRLAVAGEGRYGGAEGGAYLHALSFQVDAWFLTLRAGRHVFDPIFEEGYKGHGSYLYGNNARPADRVTVGLPAYTALPGFLRRLEVKGELSHALLDDGPADQYHREVLLHEKYAYLRYNGGSWKPYVGLNHSVLMGGYRTNGEKIPLDYWRSILGRSSEKIGGGDATNAGGAHMGLFDFGVYLSKASGTYRFYYQAPFADGSGMKLGVRNRDQILGLHWQPARLTWLDNLSVEWINTAYQSGNGMPDARVTLNNGETISVIAFYLDDPAYREELMRGLGAPNPESWSKKEVGQYLEDNFNRGNRFGGRDGYMSNGMYPAGWTYYGRVMGSPLNLSRDQVAHLNPELGTNKSTLLVNDRFKALHVGADGRLGTRWYWEGMLTAARHYGSYFQQYPGRYTWDETPGYYFKGGRSQFYSRLGARYRSPRIQGLVWKLEVAVDAGALSRSAGCLGGFSFSF